LEPEKRFLVSVGSVGQPRDGDARACYVLFDSDKGTVTWRRIPFDLDAYRQALEQAGVSADPSYFLRRDPRLRTRPVREQLNFSPAASADQMTRDAVEVQELTALKRSVQRWRTTAGVILCSALLLGAAGGTAWWRFAHRSREIPGLDMQPVDAALHAADVSLLTLPPSPVEPGASIPGWTVRLGDAYRQTVGVSASEGFAPVFLMTSDNAAAEAGFFSPRVRAPSGAKLQLQAYVKKSENFSGNVEAAVTFYRTPQGGRPSRTLTQAPTLKRRDDWWLAQQTFTVPPGMQSLRLAIRGKFTGTARVRDIALRRKE
jgi:hypothetical protein